MPEAVSKWANDPNGRIQNISLAPSPKNALFPLFEAVMNSIHAIEDRFGKDEIGKGFVDISLVKNEAGEYSGFRIHDNGIGFTEMNLESFQKMDSRKKATIGGKGVGRLLWLKVVDSAYVRSEFFENSSVNKLEFEFCIEDPLKGMKRTNGGSAEHIGTVVELHPYKDVYAQAIPKKADTIANRVLAHFISYFINISHPRIRIIDTDKEIDQRTKKKHGRKLWPF